MDVVSNFRGQQSRSKFQHRGLDQSSSVKTTDEAESGITYEGYTESVGYSDLNRDSTPLPWLHQGCINPKYTIVNEELFKGISNRADEESIQNFLTDSQRDENDIHLYNTEEYMEIESTDYLP